VAELKDVFGSLAVRLAEDMDKRIIEFFGSEQDVRRFAHLYILEEIPMNIEMAYTPDFNGDFFSVRAESRWRIRPKTLQERQEQERD
jgi:hypothetical protein